MKIAADELIKLANELTINDQITVNEMKRKFLDTNEAMLRKDIADNQAIGTNGANAILQNVDGMVRILTHCNTGSLATAGYGTALGVVRKLFEMNRLEHIYCTETRPYNQGARLTAFELVHDKLPSTLIIDSMVAALLRSKVSVNLQIALCIFCDFTDSVLFLFLIRILRPLLLVRIVLLQMVIQPIKLAPIKLLSWLNIIMFHFISLHR